MATQVINTFESGAVRLEVDYNDGNRRVTAVRCVHNGTLGDLLATVLELDGQTILYQTIFETGTRVVNIPQGRTVTIDQFYAADIPYDIRVRYPY